VVGSLAVTARSLLPWKTRARPAGVVLVWLGVLSAATTSCKKAAPPAAPPAAAPATPAVVRSPAAFRPDAAPITCPADEAFAPLARIPPAARGRGGASDPAGAGAAGPRSSKAVSAAVVAGARRLSELKTPRPLRTACTVLYEGFYWGAAALTYSEKGAAQPTFHFLTGGPHSRTLVYDVEPAPAKEIEALIRSSQEVRVTIRRTRGDRSLVRMGVIGTSGGPARPESREIGVLLQLVAHAPPKILWWGPGDQTTVEPDGCVAEQTVDFELLFRTRLERFTTTRARPGAPPAGGKPAPCTPPSSMQESVSFQATPLPSPRPL
jgi:hypothetical protein